MSRASLILFALVLLAALGWGATLLVGPTRQYTAPSAAFAVAHDGDSVLIDAGLYRGDVCVIRANNLVIRGMNGMAHLDADGKNAQGKAIWVMAGANADIEYIEFSGCTVVDKNGAGIRQEGRGLVVRHCSFHDNEDGILAGKDTLSDIVIQYCTFANNGAGDGYSHNLYIGQIRFLDFEFNDTHGAKIGHTLKSRAMSNHIVYNRIMDGDSGTASYEIDLPNGGDALIMGNVIMKGIDGQNSASVSYGMEGMPYARNRLWVVNNTFENRRSNGSPVFVRSADGGHVVSFFNNLLFGRGTSFTGSVAAVDSSSNLQLISGVSSQVQNVSSFDYHLISGAAAVNNGYNNLSNGVGWSVVPAFEYAEHADSVRRKRDGQIDIGAFEYDAPEAVQDTGPKAPLQDVMLYPNPSADLIQAANIPAEATVRIVSSTGSIVTERAAGEARLGYISFSGLHLPNGVYTMVVVLPTGSIATRQFAIEK
jgi:hypothetical protein